MLAGEVYEANGLDLVWAAALDSKHMPGSLHYVGLAVDVGLPPEDRKSAIEKELRSALGEDYDLVVEGDHWHIEFQPKRGINLAN